MYHFFLCSRSRDIRNDFLRILTSSTKIRAKFEVSHEHHTCMHFFPLSYILSLFLSFSPFHSLIPHSFSFSILSFVLQSRCVFYEKQKKKNVVRQPLTFLVILNSITPRFLTNWWLWPFVSARDQSKMS